MSSKHLIVIAGPTASGKTQLAISLAKHYQTAILSADSRQCYKELNIAVAKPGAKDLEEVTHYFINTHSIHHPVNAADFEKYGLECLGSLFKNHDIVVCCGGTGLYIQALCEGLDQIPPVKEAVHQQVNQLYLERGINGLQEEISKLDPEFMLNGEYQNPARLQRALMVLYSTGQTIRSFQKSLPVQRTFEVHTFCIDLPRSVLYERINQRVEQMLDQGLESETRNLYELNNNIVIQKTVGYAEWFPYFEGKCSKETCVEKIKQHTRNYAKRQITWFQNKANCLWFNDLEIFSQITQKIFNV